MDPIEKAIRNAFEKGNADDRAFREKVYRSAFAALDRALQANPAITVEAAINRRKSMQAKIAEIESEFLPAVGDARAEPAVDAAPAVDVGAPDPGGASSAPVPAVEGPATGYGRTAPVEAPSVPDIMPGPTLAGSVPPSAATPTDVEPDRDERRSRRRFPIGAVAGIVLLVAIGAGVWGAMQSGLLRMPEGSGQAPPVAGEAGSQPSLPAEGAPQKPGDTDRRDWITVFAPNDPTHVSAPSDARAEVMQDDTGSFLRIRSGASGSAVSFDVGQGVLERLAGKHAVFDIVARAEEGKETQMSVDCNFGELGDCGRRRYAVGHERNEYLFDVDLPDKQPGAAGSIAVNSDFDTQGKSVDIYEIRVSVTE